MCDKCYYGTLLLLQAAAAVSVISTASREDSSSTTAVCRWFLMLSIIVCLHPSTTLCILLRKAALSAHCYYVPEKGPKKLVVDPNPKQRQQRREPRSQSSSRKCSRFLLSAVVYLAVEKLRCRHCCTQKMRRNASNSILPDSKVPLSPGVEPTFGR